MRAKALLALRALLPDEADEGEGFKSFTSLTTRLRDEADEGESFSIQESFL